MQISFLCQILMNVLMKVKITVVIMLCVLTISEVMTVIVQLAILGMDFYVMVCDQTFLIIMPDFTFLHS